MQFAILYAVAMASAVNCAYVPTEPYSTLTPSATLKSGTTDYPSTFGIVVEQVATTSSSIAKRDVASQVGDGQVQATTATAKTTKAAATQIGDGQVQATTATAKTTKAAATQIGDGQVQATTATAKATTAKVASQIGDGQVQATTAKVASQIGDGQVQATTAKVASQIGDGQVQATTAKGASQIGDGQVQASTASGASQVSDGQIQATGTSGQSGVDLVSCSSSDSLSMTLKGGILTDSKGRVGSIVANRQFQFDGPPPQAGAIYAAGWEVSPEGYLAIGNTTTFYQCLSGTFYNLYDQSIGSQCHPVHLAVANLVSC